jgi:Flp pilus assembly protein TadG
MLRRRNGAWRDEDGFATSVELMYLLVLCVVAVLFLGYLGRLHAAGVQVTNTAQSAARAASLATGPTSARSAAADAVSQSTLASRCRLPVRTRLTWTPSAIGTWQGGAVTVEVACTVRNQSLTGVWSPGVRTVVMSDTQPIDRYHR